MLFCETKIGCIQVEQNKERRKCFFLQGRWAAAEGAAIVPYRRSCSWPVEEWCSTVLKAMGTTNETHCALHGLAATHAPDGSIVVAGGEARLEVEWLAANSLGLLDFNDQIQLQL